MSIFVDPIRDLQYPADGDWPFTQSCHLFGSTKEELLAFAQTINLKPIYMHYSLRYHVPHFDITVSKRNRAIKQGAIELTKRQTSEFLKSYCK